MKHQKNTNSHSHCIIITCRYDFESDLLQDFYKQPLEGLRKADLQKKLRQLENFNSEKIDTELVERALKLADGNPRLLEWLNQDVLSNENADSELSKFETSSESWKEKIIWNKDNEPKLKIDQSIEKVVSRCLVFEIPVPMPALEAVCDSTSDYKKQLSRAIELGLIEVSPESEESNRVYRVSRILPHIIPNIQLPSAPEIYSLYQKAHEKLHQLWGNPGNKSEEKWQEIFRLKFANTENPERFREGFSQMLAVQYNLEADSAFESELRKCTDNLVADRLLLALENYLQQKQWKEADEETAWIFYQVLVYKSDLLEKFPCETLQEINRLWLENSNNKFGISIQSKIYHSLDWGFEENENDWLRRMKEKMEKCENDVEDFDNRWNFYENVFINFCERLGWNQSYDQIVQTVTLTDMTPDGLLPTYRISRAWALFSNTLTPARDEENITYPKHRQNFIRLLFSRAETCKV